jgi:hypothetical protein
MFEINEPSVVSETIDGDVVIINLALGTYFSIRGTGGHVWQALLSGRDLQEITRCINHMGLGADDVAGDIERFVETLVAEGLLRSSTKTGRSDAAASDPLPRLEAYEAPVLEKFTDMKELLLLDPIHDVDEKGWPHGSDPDR